MNMAVALVIFGGLVTSCTTDDSVSVVPNEGQNMELTGNGKNGN